jgi:hypothetical protein
MDKLTDFMRNLSVLFCFLFLFSFANAQKSEKKKLKNLFADNETLVVQLTTDMKKLSANSSGDKKFPAVLRFNFSDSTIVEDTILVSQRGHFRKQNCNLAALMLQFKPKVANAFNPWSKLKLVNNCGMNMDDQQYMFKEFLVYKMYQMFTPYSLGTRMLQITYADFAGKVKPKTEYSFLIEDIDHLAKKNKCKEESVIKYSSKEVDYNQTTLLALFEYMIGNVDWSIPNYHNIKILVPKKDSNALPIPVAYDFDVTGIVNPHYAVGSPGINEDVTERVYRGFPRKMEELQNVIKVFLAKEKDLYQLIDDFKLLEAPYKREMKDFLKDFFVIIKDKERVESTFIKNARTK